MRIFCSGTFQSVLYPKHFSPLFMLYSYHYVKTKGKDLTDLFLSVPQEVLIDSGVFTMLFDTKKVITKEFLIDYAHRYAEWIAKHDRPNIIGFFELDYYQLGIEFVEYLRGILKQASPKIVPIWHYYCGIEYYYELCRSSYRKIIGIPVREVPLSIFPSFLKVAWDNGVWIHGLGESSERVINDMPFHSIDSSTWTAVRRWGRTTTFHVREDKSLSIKPAQSRFRGERGTVETQYLVGKEFTEWCRIQGDALDWWKGKIPQVELRWQ